MSASSNHRRSPECEFIRISADESSFYKEIHMDMDDRFHKAIEIISKNHRQIIDDWCKAYLAQ
jgi:hypothetical protein